MPDFSLRHEIAYTIDSSIRSLMSQPYIRIYHRLRIIEDHLTSWGTIARTLLENGFRQEFQFFSDISIPHVAPLNLASPLVLPLTSPFSPFSSRFGSTALLAAKDCSKSAIMSSMCSIPTEIRIRSSVTPLSVFS